MLFLRLFSSLLRRVKCFLVRTSDILPVNGNCYLFPLLYFLCEKSILQTIVVNFSAIAIFVDIALNTGEHKSISHVLETKRGRLFFITKKTALLYDECICSCIC